MLKTAFCKSDVILFTELFGLLRKEYISAEWSTLRLLAKTKVNYIEIKCFFFY